MALSPTHGPEVRVRRIHRRDLNRAWDFALKFYRTRSFHKLDAAIFLAKKVGTEAQLLPPRKLKRTCKPAAKT